MNKLDMQRPVGSGQSPVQRSLGVGSRKAQLVGGAASFAEGEARLAPGGPVQMEKDPAAPAAAEGQAADASAPAADSLGAAEAKPVEGADAALATLNAAGRAALAALPVATAPVKGAGKVGQGAVEAGGGLPDWFMELQNRLVQSTTWGEPEENGQHALRDFALHFATQHAGPDGKVPGQIQVFFEYIGRGSLNDAASKKSGNKGASDLGGAKGNKNWCAGAATSASNIAKKEGRAGVLADLAKRGLAVNTHPTVFFQNLAALSGATKSKQIYGGAAYVEPLLPGDRVDYLFKGCQYGGHAVSVVCDLGDTFMHVSGNTTDYSAVATGAAKRMKSSPAGLNLTKATSVGSDQERKDATQHIAGLTFDGSLVYSVTRLSDPYKALSMLETEDSKELDAALKKLILKRVAPVEEPKAAATAKSPG